MNVEVVFLPPIATDLPTKVCVVIDVLRATSTLVAMFEAGTSRVTLAETIPGALEYAESCEVRPLVCGESGGLPPAGFDLGNSPREFRLETVNGRSISFCTSNGTRAMWQVASAPVVLAGSLLNATAVVRTAMSEARARRLDIAFVCSGDYMGSKFAIDDAFCAGYLVSLLEREAADDAASAERRQVGTPGRDEVAQEVTLEESALAALRLFRSYLPEAGAGEVSGRDVPREAILRAFWESHNAQVLKRVGLEADVEFCAQIDVSERVPRLRMEAGKLVLV
ncbi:MAG: 2-phosphosulfolactate phosphatase [Sphingomonadaceae bacterium]